MNVSSQRIRDDDLVIIRQWYDGILPFRTCDFISAEGYVILVRKRIVPHTKHTYMETDHRMTLTIVKILCDEFDKDAFVRRSKA
jgi:hypothetical protein